MDGAHGFECPVFGSRCGGVSGIGFSAIRPCGHVVSDKAVREVKKITAAAATAADESSLSKQPACPVCDVPFDPAHCLPVNGTDDQVEELRAATEDRHRREDDAKAERAAAAKNKKDKQRHPDGHKKKNKL